jgi:hypothetical protein
MGKYLTFNTRAGCILILASAALIIGCQKKQEEHKATDNESPVKIVNIDELAASPDEYAGSICVEGRVIGVQEAENLFILGCEDACIGIPVEYGGHLPVEDARILVYGELKQHEDGKYMLFASEIKSQHQ